MSDSLSFEDEQAIIERAYHLYESGEVSHYEALPDHLPVNLIEAKRIEDGLVSACKIERNARERGESRLE
jgi:hypothetical protein